MSMSAPFGGGGGYWYDMMSVMGSVVGTAEKAEEPLDAQESNVDLKGDGATTAMYLDCYGKFDNVRETPGLASVSNGGERGRRRRPCLRIGGQPARVVIGGWAQQSWRTRQQDGCGPIEVGKRGDVTGDLINPFRLVLADSVRPGRQRIAARCKGPCRRGKGSSGYMCTEDAWMCTLMGMPSGRGFGGEVGIFCELRVFEVRGMRG